MAPQPKPSKSGLGSRLQAKVGPLPVWAWAAVILGAYLLYSRLHTNTSSTSNSTATPDTSGSSGADTVSSGQGSSADNMSQAMFDSLSANTSSLDALTSQLLSTPIGSGFGPTDPMPGDNAGGTASQPAATAPPTSSATAPAATGAPPAAHPTQTAAGKLSWGGLTFTTKSAFDSWAKAHGSSTTAELRNHPQARAIYSTLK